MKSKDGQKKKKRKRKETQAGSSASNGPVDYTVWPSVISPFLSVFAHYYHYSRQHKAHYHRHWKHQ